MGRTPDILLVVADCVRASDVMRAGAIEPELRALSEIARRGTTFRRAVAPSNWTLPSHASLFTGRSPWDHHLVSEGDHLGADQRTLAETAKIRGYRTASFSGSPYICERTGLVRGFDLALWGRLGDCAVRGSGLGAAPRGRAERGTLRADNPRWSARGTASRFGSRVVETVPWAADLIDRIGSRRAPDPEGPSERVSPWIERGFDSWLAGVPDKVPAFCFVNLLDAHEPYVGLPGDRSDLRSLLETWSALARGFRSPQRGNGLPTPAVCDQLHALYQRAIRLVDARLATLIEILRRRRDLDRTWIAVTSDHGQAFGDDGEMYHGYGTGDSLLRVPLVVAAPESAGLPASVDDWTVTSQLSGILERAMTEGRGCGDAVRRDGPLRLPDPEPAWALGSVPIAGVPRGRIQSGRRSRAATRLVRYRESEKLIVDPESGRSIRTLLEDGPCPPSDLPRELGPRVGDLWTPGESSLDRILDRMTDVGARLQGWGYV